MATVPQEYISTTDAIGELLGADPKFRRCLATLNKSKGAHWAKAYAKYSVRHDELFSILLTALGENNLRPTVLARSKTGDLEVIQLPANYLQSLSGELSLNRGSVLDGQFKDLPLCFALGDWRDWLSRYARRHGVSVPALRREFRKWAEDQATPIVLHRAWKAMKDINPSVSRDLVESFLKELSPKMRRTSAGRPSKIPG
jgi:hypothetical protein